MRTEDRTASIIPRLAHRENNTMDPGWRRRTWIQLPDSEKKLPYIEHLCLCGRTRVAMDTVDRTVYVVQLKAEKWVLPSDKFRKTIFVWTGVCPNCDLGYFVHYFRTILEREFSHYYEN